MAQVIGDPLLRSHSGSAEGDDQRLRILHVTTRFTHGGAERNMAHLMEWEQRRGHKVHLAVGADSRPETSPVGVRVHVIPSLRRSIQPRHDLAALRELRGLMRRHSYDVVHTHESKAGVLGRIAAVRSTRAIVHTIHMPSFGPGYPRLWSGVFAMTERACSYVTDIYLSVGHEVSEAYLRRGVGREADYLMVRSPVELEAFAALRGRDAESRARCRAALDVDITLPTAVTIGRLEPRKRPELVLRELAPMLSAGSLQLLFAGDGPWLSFLGDEAKRLGVDHAVHLLGHLDDVTVAVAASDVLVHASLVEGVPQVVLQALAAGLPVVATEMEGLREVQNASITVVPRNGEGLRRAVHDLLSGPPPKPVDLDAFQPWSSTEIDRTLEQFHATLAQRIRSSSLPSATRP